MSSLEGGPENSQEPWIRRAWLDKHCLKKVEGEGDITWGFHFGNEFGDDDCSKLQVHVSYRSPFNHTMMQCVTKQQTRAPPQLKQVQYIVPITYLAYE